jgi:hypothetical protein
MKPEEYEQIDPLEFYQEARNLAKTESLLGALAFIGLFAMVCMAIDNAYTNWHVRLRLDELLRRVESLEDSRSKATTSR